MNVRHRRSRSSISRFVSMACLATFGALASATTPGCSSDSSATPGVVFTVSGEDVALSGFAFPPAASGEPAFVDGWEVRYERLLVTVDSITLSENPDTNPGDQSQTGKVVAKATGPWAIDLTKAGSDDPSTIAVQGMAPFHAPHLDVRHEGDQVLATPATGRGSHDDPAVRLVRIAAQNQNADALFDTSVRYAVGYDVVRATSGATKMNLDAAASADYDDMIAKGQSVLYVGTATFRGGASCASSDPAYDFSKLPTVVKFRFGFATPTSYRNCQNTDLEGQAFAGEEKQRGVQVKAGAATYVQLTLHTDHPFFDSVDHDAATPNFDAIAAFAKEDGTVTLDDLAAADFTSFSDKAGRPLPWRSCIASKPPKAGTRRYDSGSVPFDKNGDPASALRGYADFVSYVQSAQGHMNADGLCATSRQYPSPR
ncbi:MAG: hypothetical protein U0169_02670 [Polyangiaceae bacterium]